jgi:formate hydrogenlyase subunit 4
MSSTIINIISVVAYIFLAPLAGALLAGTDRKISARMQGRQGPPITQPLYDVIKLIKKDTKIVNKIQVLYLVTFLVFVIITGALFFGGYDLLLVFFTLTTANIFFIIAATSNNSPYATMGANRELVQMLAYEPMTLLTAVGMYMATGSFRVDEIVKSDKLLPICYLPCLFVGFIFILTIKLRKHPFDLSTSHHAHQEMVKGITTEFNGKMLAIVEISHWYENIFLLGMLSLFFLNSNTWSVLLAFVALIICYFVEVLVDNSNARVRWQDMFKNSWSVSLILGSLNIVILEIIKEVA